MASYVYNGLAVLGGLARSPRRVLTAFRAARGATTLYRSGLAYEDVLAMSLIELRARLRVPPAGFDEAAFVG